MFCYHNSTESDIIAGDKTWLIIRTVTTTLSSDTKYTTMPFSDLPRVIILDIADQLDDVGVNVLLRTNCQIYDLLNHYLYRRDLNRTRSRSLLWAVHRGAEAQAATMVQRAIAVCGHLDLIPESFHVALQASAKEGHVHLVELLLKVKGINPNFGDGSQTPLALAVRGGHVCIVELLLAAANIDPNVTVGCFDDHILAYSAIMGKKMRLTLPS